MQVRDFCGNNPLNLRNEVKRRKVKMLLQEAIVLKRWSVSIIHRVSILWIKLLACGCVIKVLWKVNTFQSECFQAFVWSNSLMSRIKEKCIILSKQEQSSYSLWDWKMALNKRFIYFHAPVILFLSGMNGYWVSGSKAGLLFCKLLAPISFTGDSRRHSLMFTILPSIKHLNRKEVII